MSADAAREHILQDLDDEGTRRDRDHERRGRPGTPRQHQECHADDGDDERADERSAGDVEEQ